MMLPTTISNTRNNGIGARRNSFHNRSRSWSGNPNFNNPTKHQKSHRRSLVLVVALTLVATLARYPSLHAQLNSLVESYSGEPTVSAVRQLIPANVQSEINNRRARRRLLTKPPASLLQAVPSAVVYNATAVKTSTATSNSSSWKPPPDTTTLCGTHAAHASKRWSSAAPLNQHSRVVISGLLDTIGVDLALKLYTECGVKHILGLDALVPNTKQHRIQKMEVFRYLQRRIPNLQRLVVPVVGLQPFGKQHTLERALTEFQPTHLVHIPEPFVSFSSPDNPGRLSNFNSDDKDAVRREEESAQRLFQRHERLTATSHLLNALTNVEWDKRTRTHVLVFWQDDYVLEEQRILISTHHAMHGTSMVGLQLLPNHVVYGGGAGHLYGGYGDDSMLDHRARYHLGLVNMTTATIASGGFLNQTSNDNMYYLHVSDVTNAMVAGMQFQDDFASLRWLSIGSSAVNFAVLEEEMLQALKKSRKKEALEATSSLALRGSTPTPSDVEQHLKRTRHWLGWKATTKPKESIRKLLSDQLRRAFPYGNATMEQSPELTNLLPSQEISFPCGSECGYQHQCEKSAYDEVVRKFRRWTRGCKYAVYMVRFGSDVRNLPSSGARSEDPSVEAKVCRVAFVSADSLLAKRIVQDYMTRNETASTTNRNKDNVDPISLSGKVGLNGWKLAMVPGDNMTEAEYLLPKLSPSKLFSESVSRAMYVDPDTSGVPNSDTLVELMMSIDTKPRGPKRRKEYRSGTTIFRFLDVPAVPARHAVMVAETDADESIPTNAKNEAGSYVKRIQARDEFKTKNGSTDAQLQFYSDTVQMVQNKQRRAWGLIRYETYSTFPYQWIHSHMLIHDLRGEEARHLRCEWYEEQNHWGNHGLEDVSLAYVLARRRVLERHGSPSEDLPGWVPLRKVEGDGTEEPCDHAVDEKGAELYVRILPKINVPEPEMTTKNALPQQGKDAKAP